MAWHRTLMSGRKLRLILASQASRDLSLILAMSARQWGPTQRDRYRTRIDHALNDLTTFPELGRVQAAERPGLRARPAGEHIIYYWHDDETVTVLRILHRRMNPDDHLSTVESSQDVP